MKALERSKIEKVEQSDNLRTILNALTTTEDERSEIPNLKANI